MLIDRQQAEDSCLKTQSNSSNSKPARSPIERAGSSRPANDKDVFEKHDNETGVIFETNQHENVYPEGDLTGWLVVFGSFCAMGAIYGLINSSAVFETYLKSNQLKDYTHNQIGWIFSTNLFLVFFVGIQVRSHHYLSGISCACTRLPIAVIQGDPDELLEYYQILLTYSVIGGFGGALLNAPAYGAIAHYFNKKRGLATGLATTGGGVCGTIFPLFLHSLLGDNGVGFPWTCRIMGFILLGLCVPANVFIRSRGDFRSGHKNISSASAWPKLGVFRDSRFALAAVGYFFMEWGLFVPVTYMMSYATSHGIGFAEASVLLSVFNASSVVGRFVPGILADLFGRFNLIIGTIALCSISVLCIWLPVTTSKPTFTAFCVLFGFASGSNLSILPVCLGQLCELENYAQYYSTAAMAASFGTLSSVPLGGALLGIGHQSTGWTALILLSGISYLVSLACYISARIMAVGWNPLTKF